MNYPLYHTLNKNISTKKMPQSTMSELAELLTKCDDDHAKAALMLITEHSRIVDKAAYAENDIDLPYAGHQNDKNVYFDVKNLPNDLQWILWKFVQSQNHNTKNL
jgi:hypothetical protein